MCSCRIDIAEQTVACSRRGSYPLVDGREVTIATPAQLKAQIKGCVIIVFFFILFFFLYVDGNATMVQV